MPADQPLGPTDMEVRFTGNVLYLPSNATGVWNVYAPILVTVDLDDVIAVADEVVITGQVWTTNSSVLPTTWSPSRSTA